MQSTLSFSKIMKPLIAAALLTTGSLNSTEAAAQPQTAKNIVLVHGAFADGSGWKAVYDILRAKGYQVSIVQNPLTSLNDDVNATNSVIDGLSGPVVLVGHSWGGAVITEAGINPKVASLVYIAAFAPDAGESAGQWVSAAPMAPEAGFTAPDPFGYVYFDPLKFHGGFAADLSKAQSDFMSRSQVPIKGQCFEDKVMHAAWKTKPSYGIVATQDKALNPDTERTMYKRANAKITELQGSHAVFISQPEAVAQVIIAAAEGK